MFVASCYLDCAFFKAAHFSVINYLSNAGKRPHFVLVNVKNSRLKKCEFSLIYIIIIAAIGEK